jgi:homoprotocatechuate degradation regulator HpaR
MMQKDRVTKPLKHTAPTPDAFLPRDTRRSLPIALLRAREAMMSHFRPMLAAHDLTEQQWRVMRILAESDAIDASEIADRAFILAPSVTRILASLEERGLIGRSQDRNDRRRTFVSLTKSGIGVIGKVSPDSRRIYVIIERRFGRARIEALLDMLDELARLKG